MTIEFIAVVLVPIAVLVTALIIQLVAFCKGTYLAENSMRALTLVWIGVSLIASSSLVATGRYGAWVVLVVLVAANMALLGLSESRRNRSKQ